MNRRRFFGLLAALGAGLALPFVGSRKKMLVVWDEANCPPMWPEYLRFHSHRYTAKATFLPDGSVQRVTEGEMILYPGQQFPVFNSLHAVPVGMVRRQIDLRFMPYRVCVDGVEKFRGFAYRITDEEMLRRSGISTC